MHPLFEPSAKPRVFALPVHADFPKHLVTGLEQRLSKAAPESWARTTVIVNTERMAAACARSYRIDLHGFCQKS